MAINFDRAFTVINGISFENVLGIFEGTNNPSLTGEDAPVGSLYLRSQPPSVWHKIDTTDTDWLRLANLNDILFLSASVSGLESDILTLSGDISNLSASIDNNTVLINTLSGDISFLSGAIDVNTTNIAINSGDIINLSGSIDAISGGSDFAIARTTTSETINVSGFTGIRQNLAGITTTLTGATDGKQLRVHNATSGDCIIGTTINGEVNPVICSLETFDMEYHSTEGEWVI